MIRVELEVLFFLVLIFWNQFDFCFPMFQIMVMNLIQRKIRIKLVQKNFKPKTNFNHNSTHRPATNLIESPVCILGNKLLFVVVVVYKFY